MTNPTTPTAPEVEHFEPYGNGYRGAIDRRAQAIRATERVLLAHVTVALPEAESVMNRLLRIGECIVRQLWSLHSQLLEHERAVQHLHDELALTRERLGDLPPFQYDEPTFISFARASVERLRSQLGEELREEHRRWLETRAEAETQVAEQLQEYDSALEQVAAIGQEHPERVTLQTLLRFLQEPPAEPVMILDTPPTSEVKPTEALP